MDAAFLRQMLIRKARNITKRCIINAMTLTLNCFQFWKTIKMNYQIVTKRHRFWKIVLSVGLIFFLFGCETLRYNHERHYYREVVWSLDNLPEDTKIKCGYNLDAPYPFFNPDKTIDFKTKKPRLQNRIIIHYNPYRKQDIRHEAVHYLNHWGPDGKDVSWQCLNEVTAHVIHKNLELKYLLRLERDRTKYWRRRNVR